VAQALMGDIYIEGETLPREDRSAFRWYRRAARGGHAQAQYSLGLLYETGIGTEKDFAYALYWLGRAESAGVEKAPEALARANRKASDEDRARVRDVAVEMAVQ
jgi:TPR repeat protein